jgi:hypothetical protein
MGEKTEKAVKNVFSQARRSYSMGRGVVWCGGGFR